MVAQKKIKSLKTPVVENTPVVEVTPVVETPVVQKAGAKKAPAAKKAEPAAKKAEPAAKKAEPAETSVVAKKTKGVAKKAAVKKAEPKAEPTEDVEDDGKTRSFKVKLPGSTDEEFTGRFTGLTPYQAANKALSKFFRNNENNNLSSEPVVFSIKESTRGSKRHTYTYKGLRVKLDQAITYTIKSASGEERVITKQYKNQLIKIKKGVVIEQPVATA
jgi:hypothetical protein